jgi:lipopolysaccharide/colanic/teichoic acid biosynthesis glycosyltransferase
VAYRHEESLLAGVEDPATYNATVIWPDKVRLNRQYVEDYRVTTDLRLMLQTIASVIARREIDV